MLQTGVPPLVSPYKWKNYRDGPIHIQPTVASEESVEVASGLHMQEEIYSIEGDDEHSLSILVSPTDPPVESSGTHGEWM